MQGSILRRSLLVPFQPVVEAYAVRVHADHLLDFGPVPFPAEKRVPLIPAYEERRGLQGRGERAGLALSSFALSQLEGAALGAHIEEIHRTARAAVFIDFKVAERNIELPATILFGAMRRWSSPASEAFRLAGGLEGLLHAECHRFRILDRQTRMGGGLYCILAECL